MDNSEEKVFKRVSMKFQAFMGFKKAKKAIPHIPCELDLYERIAYAAGLDDSDVAKLKKALSVYYGEESTIDRFFSNSIVQELRSIACFEDRERRVVDIFHSLWGSELKCEIEEAGVQDVDRWWTGMENLRAYSDLCERKNGFEDRKMEGMYALALQKGGFDVQMNPYGGQGPDLQIKDGNLSFDIEVSRFRRNKGLERKLGEVELPEEIDSEASMLGKIKQKVKQLHEDKNGIILLKSDNTGIDWVELRRVFDQIPCGVSLDPYLNPPKLCAVILSDSGGRQEYRINPRARMPADELRPVLSRIMKALNWVKEYTKAKLRVV